MTDTARTAFLLHEASPLHDTGWGHPEHQGRLRTLASMVGRDLLALHGHVVQVPGRAATMDELLLVHSTEHVERVRAAVDRAAAEDTIVEMDPDTRVSAASWDAAVGSAGSVIAAAQAVASGSMDNAFVATRPPGHHATPDRQMGFCLFNSVAIAARWLQRQGVAERVLVLDWDVHHGNGTQDAFYDDPSVFFVSLHQSPHWPGTGSADETGVGAGDGYTLNVPLRAGTPRPEYLEALERALDLVEERFAPDFVLVSSGFDALAGDPLGGLTLEPDDFHAMTLRVKERAARWCDGRVVALLEGGYHPERTGLAAVQVVRALAGIDADA